MLSTERDGRILLTHRVQQVLWTFAKEVGKGSPMDVWRSKLWSRREVLGGLALAGGAGLIGLKPERAAAEPPPETTKLRIPVTNAPCLAPEYFAEEPLHLEGFTEVQYIKTSPYQKFQRQIMPSSLPPFAAVAPTPPA